MQKNRLVYTPEGYFWLVPIPEGWGVTDGEIRVGPYATPEEASHTETNGLCLVEPAPPPRA